MLSQGDKSWQVLLVTTSWLLLHNNTRLKAQDQNVRLAPVPSRPVPPLFLFQRPQTFCCYLQYRVSTMERRPVIVPMVVKRFLASRRWELGSFHSGVLCARYSAKGTVVTSEHWSCDVIQYKTTVRSRHGILPWPGISRIGSLLPYQQCTMHHITPWCPVPISPYPKWMHKMRLPHRLAHLHANLALRLKLLQHR